MHQVNVEYLARVVTAEEGWAFPDICLGTDSHTTMVNGLGVLGWGIGGIEAEAVMLGESLSMLLPRVVGFRLHGELPEGATATDLVLTITEMLATPRRGRQVRRVLRPRRRRHHARRTALTIANMSPEFGSTCAYFPIDDETLRYLRFTGRPERQRRPGRGLRQGTKGSGSTRPRSPLYSELVELDLATVVPSLAGPRRPQDRVLLDDAQRSFRAVLPDILGLDASRRRA